MFCVRHVHIFRALTFFVNVPYEIRLFVMQFTRSQVQGRGGDKKIEVTWRWKLYNDLAMAWLRFYRGGGGGGEE